jgi:hypothetical protein
MVSPRTNFPNGISLGNGSGTEDARRAAAVLSFVDPALADDDRFVTSTNMKVGAYTVANAASVDLLARNVTVSVTVATGADTMGTIVVTGTDLEGATITETIVPVGDATVAGLKAFRTVTSIVGAGWVISGGNDTIEIGTGGIIGLPVKLAAAADVAFSILGTAIVAGTVVAGGVGSGDGISGSTINASAGTFDGAKDLQVVLRGG